MGNPLAQLLAMLQGGPLSQLPPAGVRPDYGLTGAQIQPSDILDALRNADVKSAAMPSGPKGYAPWTKSMTPSMSGKGVAAADATAEANWARGLRAEEAALQRSKQYVPKPLSSQEVSAWESRAAERAKVIIRDEKTDFMRPQKWLGEVKLPGKPAVTIFKDPDGIPYGKFEGAMGKFDPAEIADIKARALSVWKNR